MNSAPNANGLRPTALALAVLASQAENAARLDKADDFGFPKVEPAPPIATPEEVAAEQTVVEPARPKVVQIFNVGKSYTIAPPTEAGKPAPIVRKINSKFARRILRKRGGETRVDRQVREGWAQKADARRVVGNGHEAARLLEAQRAYQREQKNLEQAGVQPVPYYDGTTVVKE